MLRVGRWVYHGFALRFVQVCPSVCVKHGERPQKRSAQLRPKRDAHRGIGTTANSAFSSAGPSAGPSVASTPTTAQCKPSKDAHLTLSASLVPAQYADTATSLAASAAERLVLSRPSSAPQGARQSGTRTGIRGPTAEVTLAASAAPTAAADGRAELARPATAALAQSSARPPSAKTRRAEAASLQLSKIHPKLSSSAVVLGATDRLSRSGFATGAPPCTAGRALDSDGTTTAATRRAAVGSALGSSVGPLQAALNECRLRETQNA